MSLDDSSECIITCLVESATKGFPNRRAFANLRGIWELQTDKRGTPSNDLSCYVEASLVSGSQKPYSAVGALVDAVDQTTCKTDARLTCI